MNSFSISRPLLPNARTNVILLALGTCVIASLSFSFFRWEAIDWERATPKSDDGAAAHRLLLFYYALLLLALGSLVATWSLRRTDLRFSLPVVWIGTFVVTLVADACGAHLGSILLPFVGCGWLLLASLCFRRRALPG